MIETTLRPKEEYDGNMISNYCSPTERRISDRHLLNLGSVVGLGVFMLLYVLNDDLP